MNDNKKPPRRIKDQHGETYTISFKRNKFHIFEDKEDAEQFGDTRKWRGFEPLVYQSGIRVDIIRSANYPARR